MTKGIQRFRKAAGILLMAMLLLSMSALSGCAPNTVVVLPNEEVRKVDNGWLISLAAISDEEAKHPGILRKFPQRITYEGAMYLLDNDIRRVLAEVCRNIPAFFDVDEVRRAVLVDMAFNLGISRLLGFKKFLAALAIHDYETAAKEMLDSKWRRDVRGRACTLARMMETGELPPFITENDND